MRALVDWQIESGTHGLVPVGTTGESPTLSHEEHGAVITATIKAARGRVPVIAGAGSNNTREAVALAGHAERAGADGLLVVTPYYNKPNQEGLYLHFKAINDSVSIPIIIYNIPPRSVIDMSVETMKRLSELKNIVGVKDATGNIARISLQRDAMGPDFIQFSGDDITALACMAAGARGCISVVANIAPRLCADLQNAALAGDFKTGPGDTGQARAAAGRDLPGGRRHRREIWTFAPWKSRRGGAAAARALDAGDQGPHPRRHGLRRPVGGIEDGPWPQKPDPNFKVVSDNRKARYNYEIGETFEAGLELTGTEVKSLRTGKATIAESYAHVDRKGEAWLVNATIPEYHGRQSLQSRAQAAAQAAAETRANS